MHVPNYDHFCWDGENTCKCGPWEMRFVDHGEPDDEDGPEYERYAAVLSVYGVTLGYKTYNAPDHDEAQGMLGKYAAEVLLAHADILMCGGSDAAHDYWRDKARKEANQECTKSS